jgi:hypothetical protein
MTFYKKSHGSPRTTFFWMSDYNIMNQIHFFWRENLHFGENWRSKVTSGDTEIKTTLSEHELFICEEVHFIRSHMSPAGHTEKSYDNFLRQDAKKMQFLWFLHPCCTKTGRHRMLICCKNTTFCAFYELTDIHQNLGPGWGLWWFGMECFIWTQHQI